MIRKIASMLRPKQPTGHPYNLTGTQFSAIKELRTHPHWEHYIELLDKIAILMAEDMFRASDEKVVLHYRSYISGLRRAGTIVDELINEERGKDARSDQRSQRAAQRADAAKLATFGSSYHSRE